MLARCEIKILASVGGKKMKISQQSFSVPIKGN